MNDMRYPINEDLNKLYDEVCSDEEISSGDMVQEDTDLVFYDTKDVARMMRCSIPTAREIMYRADFPLLRFGKTIRVSKSALEAWAMEKRV